MQILRDQGAYIVSFVRTPIGSNGGSLSSLSAIKIGSVALKEAIQRSNLSLGQVEEVIMGSVLQAGLGQNPTRQVALGAGLSTEVICTTVNKVCSSGMKSIHYGALEIMCGQRDIIACGGVESMSNTPYYLNEYRNGKRMGDGKIVDGMMYDGLFDPYHSTMMGKFADVTATTYNISKQEQDDYSVKSYERAMKNADKFKKEIVPVKVNANLTLDHDEEVSKFRGADKLKSLKPAFSKEGGSVTAGNASKISDGAAFVVLVSGRFLKSNPTYLASIRNQSIFQVLSFEDAEKEPNWFTIAPSVAIPKAIKKAGLSIDQVDNFEINEAFAAVALANSKILNLPEEKVNIWGGAVALGHPLGCSGARIVVTLCNQLCTNNKTIGCAGICNGGGGASSLVLKRIDPSHLNSSL
ncbi:predicted protein [Naegleria gruberi]|uniref:Predicted protein n=1 Tax=Naegleria gruberi TaxID=5762 RepID=D2UZI7_NAEGR|nr:uncharacterized protein NAEGRDRAFT_61951 [Naegleria gruberi]EFC49952.1 predicted protein [Naegleria gruberi]|eukprot:XP_002682696.1 predicted protein [Naegleria gruberi strain NEG-M]